MYTLEGTVLIQSSRNFVRLLIIIISTSILKLGHVGSKTRSLGQILEKNLVDPLERTILILSSRNYVRKLIIIISRSSVKSGQVGSKARLLGQILEKTLCTF